MRRSLVIVALAGLLAGACGGDDSGEAALAVVDAYFDAVNSADAEAAIALFLPDATFANNFYGDYPRETFEQDNVWATAQGTVYVDPECAEDDSSAQSDDAIVTIVCETAEFDAPSMAVGGPPVPVVITMVVGDGGIESIKYRYGTPYFVYVTAPFEDWVGEHHPEDAPNVGHFNWSTTEEARRNGLLTAEYALAWADYLEANNCTFRDGC